ncbi:MAG: hypothetical protein LC808_01010 [Actinobacteria bacterium]|nr:hypothetical protein [Actinomycetota bacterium]
MNQHENPPLRFGGRLVSAARKHRITAYDAIHSAVIGNPGHLRYQQPE